MQKSLEIPVPTTEELEELEKLYRTTRDVRLRTRAQMILLVGEQRLNAPAIAKIVRETDQTVRNWLKRYLTEGIEGLKDRPMPGGPCKVTKEYEERLLFVVRQRLAAWDNRTPCGRCNAWLITWQSKQAFVSQMKRFANSSKLLKLCSLVLSTR